MKESEQKSICMNSKFICPNFLICNSGEWIGHVCVLGSKIEKGALIQDGVKKEEIYLSNDCNLHKNKESKIVLEKKEDIKKRSNLGSVPVYCMDILGGQMELERIDKAQKKAAYERDKGYMNKHVTRIFSLTCSICGFTESIQKRRKYIEEVFLDRGWNVDADDVYCPRCSLKNRKD